MTENVDTIIDNHSSSRVDNIVSTSNKNVVSASVVTERVVGDSGMNTNPFIESNVSEEVPSISSEKFTLTQL